MSLITSLLLYRVQIALTDRIGSVEIHENWTAVTKLSTYMIQKKSNQHHHTYFSGKSYRSYMSQRCFWSVDVNGASTIDVFAFSLWKWELFCLFLSNVSETCCVVLHVYELVGRTFLDRDHICEIFGSFLVWVHIHTTGKTASACSERNSRLNW